MLKIKEQIKKFAKTDSSVLIYGKTGTGKELIAQAIHNLSDRCLKPFISVNCAAIPGTLLEAILFGTVKGSYTDAADRAGLFEQAEGGTLFLDEINSMDVTMQVKILKVIEDRYVRRIGDTKNILTDIRVLTDHYIKHYNSIMKIKVKEIEPSVYETLESYSWPGNVRELRNVVESFYNNISETGRWN